MSAACGKAGAIISALAFNSLTKKIGTPAVLWSTFYFLVSLVESAYADQNLVFFGCCIAGAGFTLLLPEVRGRDPDIVYAEELRERERLGHH